MKILAISGSGRHVSTNTALLKSVAKIGKPDHDISVFSSITDLPVFSPDAEGRPLPLSVQDLVDRIGNSDGILISSPEYVRAIPGGLKNAIDWLVSRDEIISKPIAMLHASHRGDDMLDQLRLVLSTVSDRFVPDIFLRSELMKLSPEEISREFDTPSSRLEVTRFLHDFALHCMRAALTTDDG